MIAPSENAVAAAPKPAGFVSLLYERGDPFKLAPVEEPACFHDLNLDLIVKDVLTGKDAYQLERFFYRPLASADEIGYRHEVMRDLEKEALFEACSAFAAQMRAVENHLTAAETRSYPLEKQRWVLDAASVYVEAVETLRRELRDAAPASRGLRLLGDYLTQYCESGEFRRFAADAREVAARLSEVRYRLLLHGSSITVRACAADGDYSAVIDRVFARFKQGAVKDYRVKLPETGGLNHIEAQILDYVAQLNPEPFRRLEAFCAEHRYFGDETIENFDREVQFYLSCRQYVARLRESGLPFCYPAILEGGQEIRVDESFDLALAAKAARERRTIVRNDFHLSGTERILVVTGPNQGGKTTFARAVGQIHYLAALGWPVPAREARLRLVDRILTHFEREEDVASLRGKLQDDLVRIHGILAQATPASLVIINEIFSSTSLEDAVALGRKVMDRLSKLDLMAVCVTFLDELAAYDEKTVSMVAAISPDDPSQRTFRIERRPADGLSHALAVAGKYQLTYEALRSRLRP